MVKINIDGIEENIYNRIESGEYDLTERSASFLLGYHISQKMDVNVAFEVGWIGNLETSFSPDLDVLQVDNSLIGYEVKGHRGDSEKVNKQQLYKGLGQAVSLLNQPLHSKGGALKTVSLAYPQEASNENWRRAFAETVEQTPVGFKRITMDGIETVVEPNVNPLYNEGLKQNLVQTLEEEAKSSGRQHPRNGLRNLAVKMAKEKDDMGLLL